MSDVESPEPVGDSTPIVHIVLADRGWILEKCAYEISKRFDYVSVGDKPDPRALINYYINYSAFKGKQPGIDMGFFTHIEPISANTFFDTARQLDASVCMSSIYADELEKAGVKNVNLISPGVDLDIFKPVVRIGVVGRTYKSGRKGERLVQSVMDEPGIEWHFTGEGWPGQSIMYSAEEMPNFYNNIDYLLIPSSYEGGPMSLLEALACGREVIAPPIGFVRQYPHIEYKTGDSEDLRLVLKELVKQRTQLRESVLEKSWGIWAVYHDILFRDILKKNDLKLPPKKKKNNILLAMGAVELNSRGGPSVRIEQFKEQLHQLGFKADISTDEEPEIKPYDLVHVFNIWPPESTLIKLKYLQTQNVPIVFSPIFLDLSELLWANEVVPAIFQPGRPAKEIDADILKTLSNDYLIEKRSKYKHSEFLPGYYSQIKEMIASVDYIIGLSDHEIEVLKSIAGELKPSSIVHNAIDTGPIQNADPTEFYEKFHIRDYVLCVGRIEPRKNQLMLIYALQKTNIPLVLVGQETDESYSKLAHVFAGKNVHFIGEIPHDSTLLASAYAGAKAFCLPSWSEGAPIAALEAAACGIPMILSNRSGEIEYFGSMADYCDPMDPSNIRKLIQNVYKTKLWKKPERLELQHKLSEEQTVTNFAEETLATYDLASLEFEKRILQQINYSSKLESITHESAFQADHTTIQEKLVEAEVDLRRVQAELKDALLDRDRIWNDLNATIHSKSHRIMNPLRALARFIRRMPSNIQSIKAKAKPTAFAVIHYVRMLPLFSYLADAAKKTFPGLWARSRRKMLRVHNYSEEQLKQLSSAQLHEDEQYFLHLFQDEIAKRKQAGRK